MGSKEYNIEASVSHSKKANNCGFLQILLSTLNTACHVFVLFVTIFLSYYGGRNLSDTTNLHVILCTLGYVLLMSEAIIVLTDENIWSKSLNRRSKSHIHWILQVIGACFSIIGVVILYKEKRYHFRSLHSLLGISSVGGIIILAISGLPTIFATQLRKSIRPVVIKFIHNFLGIICFCLGMASQIEAYNKRYFSNASNEILVMCIVSTYIITIFSLFGALRSLHNQLLGLFKCSQ